ncbi:MAG TPA: dihydropteroate synthase [Beijerinckiaceae bacterium]|nr:dihydropteroate synthase [Beijerinckiaceae bacterium]
MHLALTNGRSLALGGVPLVMGIVNVTPDSFSDGGDFLTSEEAVAHGLRLAGEGAAILDIGGESTRPGHAPVTAQEERARVLPVIEGLVRQTDVPISIDTMKASVAAAAVEAGAAIVNDVWGFQRDADMARIVAEAGAPAILMHNREKDDPAVDIVAEVVDFLSRSIDIALAAGVRRDRLIIDPGFGFGKTHRQSLRLIRELNRLQDFHLPILIGVSRKRAIGQVTGRTEPRARLAGSLAAAMIGAENGAAIIRAHDVAPHVDAMKIFAAIGQHAGQAA